MDASSWRGTFIARANIVVVASIGIFFEYTSTVYVAISAETLNSVRTYGVIHGVCAKSFFTKIIGASKGVVAIFDRAAANFIGTNVFFGAGISVIATIGCCRMLAPNAGFATVIGADVSIIACINVASTDSVAAYRIQNTGIEGRAGILFVDGIDFAQTRVRIA